MVLSLQNKLSLADGFHHVKRVAVWAPNIEKECQARLELETKLSTACDVDQLHFSYIKYIFSRSSYSRNI